MTPAGIDGGRGGMPEQQPDLERALAELTRRQAGLEQAHHDLQGRVLVGRSRDRLVTVRARALGGVTQVEIDPDVFDEHDERSLAGAVLEALDDVAAASARAMHEAFAAPDDDLEGDPEPTAAAAALPDPAPAPASWSRSEPDGPQELPVAAAAAAAWATAADTPPA